MSERNSTVFESTLEGLGEGDSASQLHTANWQSRSGSKAGDAPPKGMRRQLASPTGRGAVYCTQKFRAEAEVPRRALLEDGDFEERSCRWGHQCRQLCVQCGLSQDLIGDDVENVLMGAS